MSHTKAHPKGQFNKRRAERAIMIPPQMTLITTGIKKEITGARTYRNGLTEHPYVPKDPERAARLLAAIEMINRDRANAAAA